MKSCTFFKAQLLKPSAICSACVPAVGVCAGGRRVCGDLRGSARVCRSRAQTDGGQGQASEPQAQVAARLHPGAGLMPEAIVRCGKIRGPVTSVLSWSFLQVPGTARRQPADGLMPASAAGSPEAMTLSFPESQTPSLQRLHCYKLVSHP